MQDHVRNQLKKCNICQIGNRKLKGGTFMITSSHKGKKFAIDIMKIGEPKKYVLVGIDYYTRALYGKIMQVRTTSEIIKVLKEWFSKSWYPEMLISDNAKEFESIEFGKWCSNNQITHRKVGIESHGSNGRIERAIRTIREGIFKMKNKDIGIATSEVIKKYNRTYHSGIKCTPEEAVEGEDTREELRWNNLEQGEYSKVFNTRTREKFMEGQPVRIAKRENLGNCTKNESGRFVYTGMILGKCQGDSYIVKIKDGRIIKKRHYDLKAMYNETNRLEERM